MPHHWPSQRLVTAEIMDSPSIAVADHLQALAGLQRINRISCTVRQILHPVLALARRFRLSRLSLLDVACGGGDVPIHVARAAQRRGIQINLTLLDRSPAALARAQSRAASAGIVCRTIQADVLADFPGPGVDVVTSTLFLHHLPSSDQAIALLRNMRDCARRMIVVSDLQRSRWGLAAAWAGCRILSRSPVVHQDGLASVRAAWTPAELRGLTAQAGLADATISPAWPCRMLLVWERPREAPRDVH